MVDVSKMTPVEIRKLGLEILAREMGPYGLVCFLQQFERGSGDYTAERHQWLDGVSEQTVASLIAEVRAGRAHKAP